jgi:hypothetical protein
LFTLAERENSLLREAGMPMKKYEPGQIVMLLRQIEVEIPNGKTTPQVCRDAQKRPMLFLPRDVTRFWASAAPP